MAEYTYEEGAAVQAPADVVWALLIDVERWPSWTRSVRSVSLLDPPPLQVGSRVRIAQPRLPTMTWTVDRLDPGRSFSWTVQSPGAHGVAEHRVDAIANGCHVTLTIRQTGPLAGMARVLYGRLTRRYMQMEAEGLKRRAEAHPPGLP